MGPSLVVLIDADNWTQSTLYSIAQAARVKPGAVLLAFGRFGDPQLSVWRRHFEDLGFTCMATPSDRIADDDLLDAADIAVDDGTTEIWIATHDRPLRKRVAARIGSRAIVRAIDDPVARVLPRPLTWLAVDLQAPPLPNEVLERLVAAVRTHARGAEGWAFFSDVNSQLLHGPRLEPRDHGYDDMLAVFRARNEQFELDDSTTSTRVRLARLPS